MANPQTEQGHIRIANELWNELLRRDFSKRQLKLILFIWRLSYGTGQKDCKIEKFNLLELAGMYKQDVRKELKFLRDCAVLNWDETTMIFSINKNYKLWQITPNKNWDNEKFNDLIHQNLARKKVSKTLTVEDIPKPEKVSKTLTFKSELVSKILTMKLVKYLPTHGSNAITVRDSSSLKTLLYTLIIKDIKESSSNSRVLNPHTFYEQSFGMLSPFMSDNITQWCDDLSDELVIEAMKIALKAGKNFDYAEGALKKWLKKNVRTVDQLKAVEVQFQRQKENRGNYYQPKSKEVVPDWFKNRNKQPNKVSNESKESPEDVAALLESYKQGVGGS